LVCYVIAEAEEKEEEENDYDDDDIFIVLFPQSGMFNNFFLKLITKRVKNKVIFQLSRVLKVATEFNDSRSDRKLGDFKISTLCESRFAK